MFYNFLALTIFPISFHQLYALFIIMIIIKASLLTSYCYYGYYYYLKYKDKRNIWSLKFNFIGN